jgi:ribosome maturation factor RimP
MKEQRLVEALEAVAVTHGLELVDLEIAGVNRARVVRVYLDKEGGLGIDELAAANSWVDAALDELDPMNGPYTLEVSSPGIDRPLRTRGHFERFVGERAMIKTAPLGGRGNWTGVLAGVETVTTSTAAAGTVPTAKAGTAPTAEISVILLDIEGEAHRLPFADIKKAHLIGRVDFKKTERIDDGI